MTEYEENKRWLTEALESYRDSPEGSATRRFIDCIMERSRRAAKRPEEKKYHNFIVLQYISRKKRKKQPIYRALHFAHDKYDEMAERAIEWLLVFAFGVNGIDWDGPLRTTRGGRQRGGSPRPEHTEEAAFEESARAFGDILVQAYTVEAKRLSQIVQLIKADAGLSDRDRAGKLEAVKTEQARLFLQAAFAFPAAYSLDMEGVVWPDWDWNIINDYLA